MTIQYAMFQFTNTEHVKFSFRHTIFKKPFPNCHCACPPLEGTRVRSGVVIQEKGFEIAAVMNVALAHIHSLAKTIVSLKRRFGKEFVLEMVSLGFVSFIENWKLGFENSKSLPRQALSRQIP